MAPAVLRCRRAAYLWVRLDDGHAARAVRLLGVRPEEVLMVVGGLRLLLLRRNSEAAFGGLAGRRRCGRGRGSHCIVPCSPIVLCSSVLQP